jgi:hypothetical protein
MRNFKTLAYIPLLYGADYIQYAIRSVYSEVDNILILYTPKPSHGTGTELINADTKEQLIDLVAAVDPDNKIIWMQGNWNLENQQRNEAHHYARSNGYNILVAVDTDEIWKTEVLRELIQLTYDRKAAKCLVWMRHLWRSFNYICDDPMRQERIYYIGNDTNDLIYAPHNSNQVWHFGYAREFKQIEYKISIHGHSSVWLAPKEKWFKEKYCAWPPVADVHPVCADTWNPKPFDKSELPELMKEHPYYDLEMIE